MMAKLTPQVKGIIRFARRGEDGHRITKQNAQALRRQLRNPGVSKREKSLTTRLMRKDALITNNPRFWQTEGKGIKQAFREQDKLSSQAAGRNHPHQGGNPAKSFDSGSVGDHMKYKP